MQKSEKLQKAFAKFDAYNATDPNTEEFEGKTYAKEVLYAERMTKKLNDYAPEAPEYMQLAVRCQHIGRWEIARNSYPMDRAGYLMWRSQLKLHHTKIAGPILKDCSYDEETISKVKALLLKKQLHQNPDTQLIEDVICLVFVEYYLDDFAKQHSEEKMVDILQKTLKKISPHGIEEALKINMTAHVKELILKAAA
ncbi:DUF4202 domain-containing protein [Mucilaginibacter arboris]|uniref:DUF4202 family protein n=1 Tax=Mucilaginibacter arboris TaxID=2682090 RepID=A0A7K1SUU9_9SPHI|nr:DUF4202 domain-containing protein [Mucilaginibacter arboris]MVN21101.1 DUF4202 family protein [Mucilaginibacter arboris]